MKGSVETFVLLVFFAAVAYMLVRPGSPAPEAIKGISSTVSTAALLVAGG